MTQADDQALVKNLDTYSSGITNSAFSIRERKFAAAADRLRVLIAREKLMPGTLQQARANLSHPPKVRAMRDSDLRLCPAVAHTLSAEPAKTGVKNRGQSNSDPCFCWRDGGIPP
jgi:hypothetical protein